MAEAHLVVSCQACGDRASFPLQPRAAGWHLAGATGWMVWWSSGTALCQDHIGSTVY